MIDSPVEGQCPTCEAPVLEVLLDDKSFLMVDAMPALHGNVAARFSRNGRKGWQGYRLPPERNAPPQHVTFNEHTCSSLRRGSE